MLHYPLFKEKGESLEERQINLTRHCISKLDVVKDKKILDVGCGNGTQSFFIKNNYFPSRITGVDINDSNIQLARSIKGEHEEIEFMVDDAQELNRIPDNSVDLLLCIESAFHYPDKHEFMSQIHRVLKPTGKFLIADILTRSYKNRYIMEKWKKKMSYFHWTIEDYFVAFKKNRLVVDSTEDITKSVIRGYRGFDRWITRRDVKSFFEYFLFKLLLYIQVKLNIFLLKKRRQYYIFVGRVLK